MACGNIEKLAHRCLTLIALVAQSSTSSCLCDWSSWLPNAAPGVAAGRHMCAGAMRPVMTGCVADGVVAVTVTTAGPGAGAEAGACVLVVLLLLVVAASPSPVCLA